jgi:hypothetical protein
MISQTVSKSASTDETSIINSNSNQDKFKTNINSVINEIMNLFQCNLLTMNCNMTNFLVFGQKWLQIQIVPQ